MPSKPSDFEVANASGANVRSDLNDIFDAIGRNNGYGSTPNVPLPYMWYANTSTNKMGFYKAIVANGRHEFISLTDGSFFGPNGTASNPSYTFTNSPNLGIFRQSANVLGISTDGVARSTFNNSGQTLIGNFTVAPTSGEARIEIKTNGINNEEVYIDFVADTTYTDYGLRLLRGETGENTQSQLEHRGTGALELIALDGGTIDFKLGTTSNNTNLARWRFHSSGAFVWAEHTAALGTGADVSGSVVPKGIASKTGSNAGATTSGNLYNFYWTGSALKCWVDEVDQGVVSISSSDYRIKQKITTQTALGIDKIKQLRPVNYEYKNYGHFKADGVAREGFIAHELQEVIPSAVNDEKDGDAIQSLNLDAIVSVLTKALQESIAKIETLEAKVAALEAK